MINYKHTVATFMPDILGTRILVGEVGWEDLGVENNQPEATDIPVNDT